METIKSDTAAQEESKLEPKNYRPVSILSPLSKVVERVIYDQVYNYFSDNNLFLCQTKWEMQQQLTASKGMLGVG